ncbi:hypothetical protein [Polaromonas sp. YR568]|uniref:hypothetical protein n=1 Tax=Polaromonas sp. YR568 TaxID=1855301 RepID=UPI003137CD43
MSAKDSVHSAVADSERVQAPAPWEPSICNAPLWMGGSPAGHCQAPSYGHQLPARYLEEVRGWSHPIYCFGHACPAHGGPQADEVRIFQDGLTNEGRRMWCAVQPDFINLHESHAGFDGNPVVAVAKLRAAIAKAEEAKP